MNHLLKSVGFLCLLFSFSASCNSHCFAQVSIFDAGQGVAFVDMGLDETTDELVLVGTRDVAGQSTPSVFHLASDRTTFSSATLVGLGDNTRANNISPDGYRIAGASDSAAAVALGGTTEGITWLSSAPSVPVAIGFPVLLGSNVLDTNATLAWRDGVAGAGSISGLLDDTIFSWTPEVGPTGILDFFFGLSVGAVSGNGDTLAYGLDFGFPTQLLNPQGGPSGVVAAPGLNPRATALSPNGSFIVGNDGPDLAWIGVEDSAGDYQAEAIMVVDPITGSQTLLDAFAVDVSNSGYAIANSDTGLTYIWHESFGTALRFDDWLSDFGGAALPSASTELLAISESASGTLHFAVNSGDDRFIVSVATASSVVGDFDGNGVVDCVDLDGYVGNLGATVTAELASLDLDNDGTITAADANTHITTLVQTTNGQVGTFLGDLNCDGTVSVLGDAFSLVANLNATATSYLQGDLNFDGTVNVLGDAFILINNLGMTNVP